MSDYNKVVLLGRLCKKPELRFTPGGDAVCELRLAVSEKYKTKGGEPKENTLFIDAVVWRQQAENCAEYLVKGQRVLVDGKLKSEEWEKDGDKKKTYKVQAHTVVFLDKPKSMRQEEEDQAPEDEDDNDQIPF